MKRDEPRPEKAEAAGEYTQKSSDLVANIATVIEKAGERGVSREEIYAEIVRKFPDYDQDAVQTIINSAVPGRISREKFKVEQTGEGRYRKA